MIYPSVPTNLFSLLFADDTTLADSDVDLQTLIARVSAQLCLGTLVPCVFFLVPLGSNLEGGIEGGVEIRNLFPNFNTWTKQFY